MPSRRLALLLASALAALAEGRTHGAVPPPPDHPELLQRFEFLGPVLRVEHLGRRGAARGPTGKPLNATTLVGRRLRQELASSGERFPLIDPTFATEMVSVPFPHALESTYDVEEKLGQGSSGITFLAIDKKTNQEVAVKIFYLDYKVFTAQDLIRLQEMQESGELDADALEGYTEECKKVQAIQETTKQDAEGDQHVIHCLHDGVAEAVATLEKQPHSDAPLYIVMTYGGEDMERWWASNKVKDGNEEVVSKWVRQAARQLMLGLRAMTWKGAEKKWVHHDVKPANVVVRPAGPDGEDVDLTIIDLGAAISDDSPGKTAAATPLWTPLDMFGRQEAHSWEKPVHSFDMASAGMMLLSFAKHGDSLPSPTMYAFMAAARVRAMKINFLSELHDCIASEAPAFSYQAAGKHSWMIEEQWVPAFQMCIAEHQGRYMRTLIKDKYDRVRGAKGQKDKTQALKMLIACSKPQMSYERVDKRTQQVAAEWVESGFVQVLLDMYHMDPAKRPTPEEVLQAKWLAPDYSPPAVAFSKELVECPELSMELQPVLLEGVMWQYVALTFIGMLSPCLFLVGCCRHCCGKAPSPRYIGLVGGLNVVGSAMAGLMWLPNAVALPFVLVSLALGPGLTYAGGSLARKDGPSLTGPWPMALYAGLAFCGALAAALRWSTGGITEMLAMIEIQSLSKHHMLWEQLPQQEVAFAVGAVQLSTGPPTVGMATMLFGIWREDRHRRLSRGAVSARSVAGTELQSVPAGEQSASAA